MSRLAAALCVSLSLPLAAFAAGEPEFNLVIQNHRFAPDRIEVPAGKKVKLLIENKDATPEEFESHDLRIEKVIPSGKTVRLRMPALKPGVYSFVGEYHEKTAKGRIVAE